MRPIFSIIYFALFMWLMDTVLFSETCKILFIGNSLTFYNDQPEMFQSLAAAANRDVFVDQITIGGADLIYHSTNPETIDKIYTQDWDYVILQGTGYYIAFPEQHHIIRPAIMLLDSLVHDNCEKTKVVLFMRFAKPGGLTWNQEYYDFLAMQNLIYEGCMIFADQTDFMIAPTGCAWKQVSLERNDIELNYYNDLNHPSAEGSYLIACVYFSTIFQEDLDANTYYGTLSSDIGQYLQSVALRLVVNNLEHWHIQQTPGYAVGTSTQLYQNFPNLFNQKTVIPFRTEANNNATLEIFNVKGQLILRHNQYYYSGFHAVESDGKSDNQTSLPSGVYFYKLTAAKRCFTKRMILME